MVRFCLYALCLACPDATFGADPVPAPVPKPPALLVPAEVRGEPGEFIAIDTVTDGKSVKFFSLDRGLSVFPASKLATKKDTIVLAINPGTYRVLCYTTIGDELTDPAVCTVIVGKPIPTPGPPPPPNVDPNVDPVVLPAAKLWVIVIADRMGWPTDQAALVGSATLRKAVTDSGHRFQVLDSTSDAAKPFAPNVAKAGGLPVLVLMEQGGSPAKVRASIKLPDSESAFLAAVKAAAGK